MENENNSSEELFHLSSIQFIRPLFIETNDASLCREIRAAQREIGFVGAGMTAAVARALAERPKLVSTVVIDNSEVTFTHGYGSVEALKILKDAGIRVMIGKAIRINILALDDKALVYSPTALSIEEVPNSETPGGIRVSYGAVAHIFRQIRPEKRQEFEEAPSVSNGHLIVKEMTREELKKDIQRNEANPPHFDLSRQLNVYKARIQFVEVRLQGFDVKSHTVRIPQELIVLSGGNRETQDQLKASYRIFGKTSAIQASTAEIEKKVKKFREKFVVQLPKYGAVCAVKDKPEMKKALAEITKLIQEQQATFFRQIVEEYKRSIQDIKQILSPRLRRNPPKKLYYFGQRPSNEEVDAYIIRELRHAFGDPQRHVRSMDFDVDYKDVTYETLKDENFRKVVRNSKLGKLFPDNNIMDEGLAAAERK